MKTLEINVTVTDDSSRWEHDHFRYETEQVLNHRFGRFGLGGWAKGAFGRLVDGGPKVEGPAAYAYGLGVAICADPARGTGAEAERKLANKTEHFVETGDHVIIDGVEYEIVERPNRNIDLCKV